MVRRLKEEDVEKMLAEILEELFQRLQRKCLEFGELKCRYDDNYRMQSDHFRGIVMNRGKLLLGIKKLDALPEISLWINDYNRRFRVLRISIRDYFSGKTTSDRRIVFFKKAIIIKVERPLVIGHPAAALVEKIIMPEFNRTKIPQTAKKYFWKLLKIQEIDSIFIGKAMELA